MEARFVGWFECRGAGVRGAGRQHSRLVSRIHDGVDSCRHARGRNVTRGGDKGY